MLNLSSLQSNLHNLGLKTTTCIDVSTYPKSLALVVWGTNKEYFTHRLVFKIEHSTLLYTDDFKNHTTSTFYPYQYIILQNFTMHDVYNIIYIHSTEGKGASLNNLKYFSMLKNHPKI